MIIGKTRTNQPVEDGGVIDAEIKSQVEGGTLSNAKPIYCHPISYFKASEHLTMLIFNNLPTAFTGMTDLLTYIRSWGLTNARIMVSGSFYDETETPSVVVASYLNVTSTTAKLVGNRVVDNNFVELEITSLSSMNFVDAVNRIN